MVGRISYFFADGGSVRPEVEVFLRGKNRQWRAGSVPTLEIQKSKNCMTGCRGVRLPEVEKIFVWIRKKYENDRRFRRLKLCRAGFVLWNADRWIAFSKSELRVV